MINCNYLENLYLAVKHRAFQIECEIQLLQEQFFYICNFKGVEDRLRNLIFFKFSSLDAIHKIYECYLEIIQENIAVPWPFKKAMQYHFAAICSLFDIEHIQPSQPTKNKNFYEKVSKNIEVLSTNQEALKKLMGYDLFNCDGSIEKLIEALYFLFPYNDIIKLISFDNTFFTNLIKTAYEYDGSTNMREESHIKCLKQVYKAFPQNWGNYNKETILAISEVLLSIFTFQQENQNAQTNLECFEISERCKYLVKRNLEQLSIKPDFISIMEKNLGFNLSKTNQEDINNVEKIKPLEYDNDSQSPIMCIHHVVLELRKLPLQPSISFMCVILMRTMNFLNTALCTEGKYVGADESFQFFVAALADARLYHLPKILDQMKTFIVSDLTVGKISFLISQLECAIDFIKTRILPVPQYILFPFRENDIKVLHLVTPNELKTNDQSNSNNNDTDKKLSEKDQSLYSYVDVNFDSNSDNDKLILTGFVVCAFPTFLRGKSQIPSVLFCTGDVQDKAVVYRYTLNSTDNINDFFKEDLGPKFQSYGCIHGIIYHMNKKSDYKGFIHIDRPCFSMEGVNPVDYLTKVEDVAEFSNMMLMMPEPSSQPSSSPSSELLTSLPSKNGIPAIHFGGYAKYPDRLHLSLLPKFKEKFRISWERRAKPEGEKIASDENSTSSARYYHQMVIKTNPDQPAPQVSSFQRIKDIQIILQKLGVLSSNYEPTGIIDKETVYAICKINDNQFCKNFVLTEKNYNHIMNILQGSH